jgi:hypothetical protein
MRGLKLVKYDHEAIAKKADGPFDQSIRLKRKQITS